jgi:hypothetical protein
VAVNVEYDRASERLYGLHNGVDDIPVRFQGGVWEAGCIHAGTVEAFQERVVVTAKLDFDSWINTAETK